MVDIVLCGSKDPHNSALNQNCLFVCFEVLRSSPAQSVYLSTLFILGRLSPRSS